jgi:hypothetical protein
MTPLSAYPYPRVGESLHTKKNWALAKPNLNNAPYTWLAQ